MTVNGVSPLRAALDAAIAEAGYTLNRLTVLARENDPFRVDTPARHRDGQWLATLIEDLGLGGRDIYPRGLHYAIVMAGGRLKPDGTLYANTDKDWQWLQGDAIKAARWLNYIPFGQITDHRNDPPVIREFTPPKPGAYLSTDIEVDIPGDITPELYPLGFRGTQPYKLVIYGEKSSLEPVLGDLAAEYEADLYLPTGEISDTLLHRMAETGNRDGRPMVVFCFSDCDPAGWQMPISIARKLQAFKVALFPGLEFQVRRAALTPHQAVELGLPSTPLKPVEKEKRADRWRAAMGIEQTEIDALVMRPDLLQQIARDALGAFFDATLSSRVASYRREWEATARDTIGGYITDRHDQILREAERQLESMREQIDALNDQLRIDVDEDDLPPIDLPQADVPDVGGVPPLIDSGWDFADQCEALIGAKAYLNGNGS
jgi:hypothetical protein